MEPERHPLLDRLHARRERHAERGRLYRVAFAVAGFAVLAAGLAMLVLPGPGVLVSAVGLAMLALEFAWAEQALERTLRHAERGRRALGRRGLIALAFVAAGALTAAALLLDLP